MGEIGTHEGRFWPCVFEPGQARKKSVLSHNWWMLCRSDFLKMAASLLSISGASTLEASGRQMDRQCAISFLTPVCLMCLWDFGIWLIAFSRWVHISLRVAMHLSKPYIPAFPVQKKKRRKECERGNQARPGFELWASGLCLTFLIWKRENGELLKEG